jgi:hypothetical protein
MVWCIRILSSFAGRFLSDEIEMLMLSHLEPGTRRRSITLLPLVFCFLFSGSVNGADWEPVEDPALLREL